jgi:hypothetical protein
MGSSCPLSLVACADSEEPESLDKDRVVPSSDDLGSLATPGDDPGPADPERQHIKVGLTRLRKVEGRG